MFRKLTLLAAFISSLSAFAVPPSNPILEQLRTGKAALDRAIDRHGILDILRAFQAEHLFGQPKLKEFDEITDRLAKLPEATRPTVYRVWYDLLQWSLIPEINFRIKQFFSVARTLDEVLELKGYLDHFIGWNRIKYDRTPFQNYFKTASLYPNFIPQLRNHFLRVTRDPSLQHQFLQVAPNHFQMDTYARLVRQVGTAARFATDDERLGLFAYLVEVLKDAEQNFVYDYKISLVRQIALEEIPPEVEAIYLFRPDLRSLHAKAGGWRAWLTHQRFEPRCAYHLGRMARHRTPSRARNNWLQKIPHTDL